MCILTPVVGIDRLDPDHLGQSSPTALLQDLADHAPRIALQVSSEYLYFSDFGQGQYGIGITPHRISLALYRVRQLFHQVDIVPVFGEFHPGLNSRRQYIYGEFGIAEQGY